MKYKYKMKNKLKIERKLDMFPLAVTKIRLIWSTKIIKTKNKTEIKPTFYK